MLSLVLGGLLLFPQLVDSTNIVSQPVPSSSEITNEKRGDIFTARKMYREAVEAYQAALNETSEKARIYNKIGLSYHRQQMLGEARRNYERASKLDKDFGEAVNNLGTVYFAQKKYGRAQRTYQKAIKLVPDSASFHSNLGTVLFARRRYEKATQEYLRALELDPNVFDSGGRTGTTLQDRTVEESGKYYYYLAQAYASKGIFDRALIYLRRSLEEGYGAAKRAPNDDAFKAMLEMPEFLALFGIEQTATAR